MFSGSLTSLKNFFWTEKTELRFYLLAVFAAFSCALVRYSLDPIFGNDTSLLIFVLPPLAAAVFGGLGPGLFATFLATMGAFIVLFYSRTYVMTLSNPGDWLRLSTLFAEGTAISLVFGQLRRAREEAELSLKLVSQGKDRLKLAFQAAQIGSWMACFRTETAEWSPEQEAIFGLEPGSFKGTFAAFKELLYPDDRERVIDTIMASAKTGVSYSCEYRIVQPNGDIRWVISKALIERDAQGIPVRAIGIVRDRTKQKMIENDLRLAKEAAEAANQTKSTFLANMSHEIRTPLGAVLGFSELLADNNVTAAERTDYVSAIKRNGKLLSNIINDILDLSRVEAGKLELDIQDFTLAELIEDTLILLRPKAAEKNIKLSFVRQGDVPESLRSDVFRLKQILLNIVGNAIKFTQSGSVAIVAKTFQGEDGTWKLAFNIKDTGPGIPEELSPMLFLPFSQVDASLVRRHGGTGLGLALSRHLAKILGGDLVLLWSQNGVGSEFMVSVDFSKGFVASVANPINLRSAAIAKEARPDLAGINVLVVDDARDNQVLVSHLLTRAGANVDTADNGSFAVAKAETGAYDVLLMDIQMPVMDGFEAANTLRRNGYKGPIIALTAHAMREQQDLCLANGFDGHLTKPIDHHSLLRTVYQYGHT